MDTDFANELLKYASDSKKEYFILNYYSPTVLGTMLCKLQNYEINAIRKYYITEHTVEQTNP